MNKKKMIIRASVLALCIALLLALATVAGSGIFGDSVLSFAFLSMALRCTTLVIPFVLAVYFKGRANRKLIVLSEILGPLSVIFFGLTNIIRIDELYIGMAVVLLCTLLAMAKGQRA